MSRRIQHFRNVARMDRLVLSPAVALIALAGGATGCFLGNGLDRPEPPVVAPPDPTRVAPPPAVDTRTSCIPDATGACVPVTCTKMADGTVSCVCPGGQVAPDGKCSSAGAPPDPGFVAPPPEPVPVLPPPVPNPDPCPAGLGLPCGPAVPPPVAPPAACVPGTGQFCRARAACGMPVTGVPNPGAPPARTCAAPAACIVDSIGPLCVCPSGRPDDGTGCGGEVAPVVPPAPPPVPAAAAYACPAGSWFSTNPEGDSFCIFPIDPMPATGATAACDALQEGRLGFTYARGPETIDYQCPAAAKASPMTGGVGACTFYVTLPAAATVIPYCHWIERGYIGFQWRG